MLTTCQILDATPTMSRDLSRVPVHVHVIALGSRVTSDGPGVADGRTMLRSVALAVPILTTVAGAAHAQPSLAPVRDPILEPVEVPEMIEETTTYRDQILVASGIGLAAFLGGMAAEKPGGGDTDASETLMGVGFLTVTFAPPAIHLAHGEIARGFGSVGLRWGLGMLGAVVAVSIHECDSTNDWFCELDAIGPGFLVGLSAASLIDAFGMSEQKRWRPRTERTWTPVVAASSQGGQLGLAGTF